MSLSWGVVVRNVSSAWSLTTLVLGVTSPAPEEISQVVTDPVLLMARGTPPVSAPSPNGTPQVTQSKWSKTSHFHLHPVNLSSLKMKISKIFLKKSMHPLLTLEL